MAGGRNVGHGDGQFVETGVQYRPDEDTRIQRHRLTRFEIDFRARILFRIAQEFDQLLALVIGAGDMVAPAHVDPLELAEPRFDRIEHLVPCGMERFEILFAQIVEMDTIDLRHDFRR